MQILSTVGRTQSGVVFREENRFFDDVFSPQQVAFLAKYIMADTPCIYFGNAKVGSEFGENGHFHPTPLLTVLSDKWF